MCHKIATSGILIFLSISMFYRTILAMNERIVKLIFTPNVLFRVPLKYSKNIEFNSACTKFDEELDQECTTYKPHFTSFPLNRAVRLSQSATKYDWVSL